VTRLPRIELTGLPRGATAQYAGRQHRILPSPLPEFEDFVARRRERRATQIVHAAD